MCYCIMRLSFFSLFLFLFPLNPVTGFPDKFNLNHQTKLNGSHFICKQLHQMVVFTIMDRAFRWELYKVEQIYYMPQGGTYNWSSSPGEKTTMLARSTMVDHGSAMVEHAWTMVDYASTVSHGWNMLWPWLTMALPWLTMVGHGWPSYTSAIPWLTMVGHGWPSYTSAIPWLTMVNHGWPWLIMFLSLKA